MKIIKVEGCSGCPYQKNTLFRIDTDNRAFCEKTIKMLDITWSVNPYYSHPDCPLEEVKE